MSFTKKVIIIDDDPYIQSAICDLLEDNQINTISYSDPSQALEYLTNQYDVHALISDVRMQPMDGIELLKQVKGLHAELPVILITGFEDMNKVIDALRIGAYDYIKKPFENEYLLASIRRAIEKSELIQQNRSLTININEKEKRIRSLEKILYEIKNNDYSFSDIIGKSENMRTIFQMIRDTAVIDANVLITGETGTGKEMVAKAIHQLSNRKEKPFVPINCGAVPANLIESELFGHEAGAFTNAIKRKIGKFEYTDGGTLFLDEIGELSVNLQVKLLRVLQDKLITRLGSNTPIQVDVRIIAATNRDLEEMIKNGLFREDLFYRLNVIPIHMPPLRERKEDILLLTIHFINKFNVIYHKNIESISETFHHFIMSQTWKGNVRELENTIERYVVLSKSNVLDYVIPTPTLQNSTASMIFSQSEDTCLKRNTDLFEKSYILDMLKKQKGSIQNTAEALDVNVKTLYRKMKKFNIEKFDSMS